MNPVHRGHVEVLRLAMRRLEALGYAVVGAWLSPLHESWLAPGGGGLSGPLRVRLAQMAVKDEDLMEVATWTSSGQLPAPGGLYDAGQLALALRATMCAICPEHQDWLHVFYVCGADELGPHIDYLDTSRSCGAVIVPRAGCAAPTEQPRRLLYVTGEQGLSPNFSGTFARAALARGDFGAFAAVTPPPVARLVASPSLAEWVQLGSELAKLGIRAPRGAEVHETKVVAPAPAPMLIPAGVPVPVLGAPAPLAAPLPVPVAVPPATVPPAGLGPPCKACGFTGSAVTAKFCSECGARRPDPPAPPPPAPTPPQPPAPPPGAVALAAKIQPPPGTSMQTLEALDKIVQALQKQGLKLEGVFRRLDVDRSGTLDRPEFVAGMQMFTGADVSPDDLLSLWMSADADQDGKVTLEEFLGFLGRLPAHVAEAKRAQAKASAKPEPPPVGASQPAGAAPQEASPSDPPPVLWVESPNGQQGCAGQYRLVSDQKPGGWPVWQQSDGGHWLYSSKAAMWSIGGSDARDQQFDCNLCFIYCKQANGHAGVLPHMVADGEWQRWVPEAAGWRGDRQISVTEVRPAGEKERFLAALRGCAMLRLDPKAASARQRAADLLMLGVDLTAPLFSDDDGGTLLALAAGEGWCELCRALCANPRSYLDAQSEDMGWTALLRAVRGGHLEAAGLLLGARAAPDLASWRGALTPLMLAADLGHADLCRMLLSAQADPFKKDCNAATALDLAWRRASAPELATDGAAATSCLGRFQETVDVLQAAITPPVRTLEAKAPRRKRRVTYPEGDQIRIEWLVDEDCPEVLVKAIIETDRAFAAGVRPGWGLITVNDEFALLDGDAPQRQQAVTMLTPPVTLEFGRPTEFPEDVWLSHLTTSGGRRRTAASTRDRL